MKVWVVTGADSGLGEQITSHIRREALPDSTVIPHLGIREGDLTCDLTFTRYINRIKMYLGDPSEEKLTQVILINCAAHNHLYRFEDLRLEDYKYMQEINVEVPWLLVQALLPWLKPLPPNRLPGIVCNIVSNAAYTPMSFSLAYNVSKAGLDMVTRQLAHELTPQYGITIFGLAPHRMRGTQMPLRIDEQVFELRGWTAEEAKAYQMKTLLNGEEADPKAVAQAIVWLCSHRDICKTLTGSVLRWGK